MAKIGYCLLIMLLLLAYPVTGVTSSKIITKKSTTIYMPCKNWNNTYGGNFDDRAYSIVEAEDGYLIGGITFSFGRGNGDAWLIKVSENGEEIWNKTYGENKEDGIYDILQIKNGYMIAGKTKSFGKEGYNGWLIKVDENGEEIWNKIYGANGDEVIYSICQTNGGYLLAGITSSFGKGIYDAWLIKVDENGNETWNKAYGGILDDYIYSIEKIEDGYIMAGTTKSQKQGYNAWLIKVDENGNEIWNKTFDFEGDEFASQVASTEDGFIMAGTFISFEKGICDAFLVKTDNEGNEIWHRTYGGEYMDAFNSILAQGNEYVAVGSYGLASKKGGAWIIKTDENGNVVWNKTIGGKTGDDYAWTFLKEGKEYIIVGSTTSYSRGGYDVWLIKVAQPELKIDAQGGLGLTVTITNMDSKSFTNLRYTISLQGLVFIGKHLEGTIQYLSPGEKTNIHIFALGLANVVMRVTVGEISRTVSCFMIGPFVMVS